jgi:DNA-binding FadR family transcriptional regulator
MVSTARPQPYQRIASDLATLIADWHLQPGDRLPPETQLAQRFGVSRTIIREALKVLTTVGLISSRRGSGHYVRREPSALMSVAINYTLALESTSVLSLLEFRRLIETDAAGLAAERITPPALAALEDLVATQSAGLAAGDLDLYERSDDALHVGIGEASGNPFLAATIAAVTGLASRAVPLVSGITGSREAAIAQHQAILAALRLGDPAAARQAMELHITTTIRTHQRALAVRPGPGFAPARPGGAPS